MSFINAFKIALSRSGLVFKILLYDIVVFALMAGVCAGVLLPAFNTVGAQIGHLEVVDKLVDGLKSYFISSEPSPVLAESLKDFYVAIAEAFEIIKVNIFDTAFITVFVVIIVGRFLFSLRTIPVYDIINSYMSEGSNYYFLSNLIHNFGKSARFAGLQMLFSLPFDLILFLFGYFVIGYLFSLLGFFAPFVVVAFIICLLALRYTVFFFWLPLVIHGRPVIKAFSESLTLGIGKFWESFALMVVYLLLLCSVCIIAIITTYGVGLLLCVPMFFVLLTSLQMVKFHDIKRLRYYVNAEEVISPSIVEGVEINDREKDFEEYGEDGEKS